MSETFVCAHCGKEHPIEDRCIFDGQELCRECYGTETCICDQCGKRIWLNDDYGDAHHTLCQDCMERYYDRCIDCGRLVELDQLQYLEDGDDDGYCSACFERHLQESGVHSTATATSLSQFFTAMVPVISE